MVSLIKKHSSYALCTVLGAGFFPWAPGSFASILAVVLLYLLQPIHLILAAAILITFLCGIVFSSEIEKIDGKDPQHIVIDELTGQWLTFLLISKITFVTIIAGFLLFRFFDIIKHLVITGLQDMKNGWGVMMDDVLAGIYSNLILQLLILTGIFI